MISKNFTGTTTSIKFHYQTMILNATALANGSRFIAISEAEILHVEGRCLQASSIDLEKYEILANSALGFTSISYGAPTHYIAYATRSVPPYVVVKHRFTEKCVEIKQNDNLLEIQYLGFSPSGKKLAAFGKDLDGYSLYIWGLNNMSQTDENSFDLLLHRRCRYPGCQVIFDPLHDENTITLWCQTNVMVANIRESQLQGAELKVLVEMTEPVKITCIHFDENERHSLLGLSNGSIAKVKYDDGRIETIFRDSLASNACIQNIFFNQEFSSFVIVFNDGRISFLSKNHDDQYHIIKECRVNHEIIEASLAPDLITMHILLSTGTLLRIPMNQIECDAEEKVNSNAWKIPDCVVDFGYVVLTGSPSSVLVTASIDGTLKVWPMPDTNHSKNNWRLLGRLDLSKRITVIEVLKGYPVCCVAFNDGSITFVHFKRIHGTENIHLSSFHSISLCDEPIKLISFHHKKRKVAFVSSAKRHSIFVLDMDSFNIIGDVESLAPISFLSWSPDQEILMFGTLNGEISCYAYDSQSIRKVWGCNLGHNYINVALTFASFENNDNLVSLWRIDPSFRLLQQHVSISHNSLEVQNKGKDFESVRGCTFALESDTNGIWVTAGSSDGSISCFKMNSDGSFDLKLKSNVHTSTIVSLQMSPDRSQVCSLRFDGSLSIASMKDHIESTSIKSSSYAMDHLVAKCRSLNNKSSLIKPTTGLSNDDVQNLLRNTNCISESPNLNDKLDGKIYRALEKLCKCFDSQRCKPILEDYAIHEICSESNKLNLLLKPKRIILEKHLKSLDSRNCCHSGIIDVCEDSICGDALKILTDDIVCLSADEVLETYDAVTKLHEEKYHILKSRLEIEHEIKKSRWRIELLTLEEFNLKEIVNEIKTLSKQSQRLNCERTQEVSKGHTLALEKVQNAQKKLLKILKLKEQDNDILIKQIDELSNSVVFLEKERLSVREKKNDSKSFMKNLPTKNKLMSTVKIQEMEIKKLMNHLEKLRQKSFPSFSQKVLEESKTAKKEV
jgi:WD40 repeat protein